MRRVVWRDDMAEKMFTERACVDALTEDTKPTALTILLLSTVLLQVHVSLNDQSKSSFPIAAAGTNPLSVCAHCLLVRIGAARALRR